MMNVESFQSQLSSIYLVSLNRYVGGDQICEENDVCLIAGYASVIKVIMVKSRKSFDDFFRKCSKDRNLSAKIQSG